MIKPSIFLQIIFFVLIFLLIKRGYWQGFTDKFREEFKNKYRTGIIILMTAFLSVLFIDYPLSHYFSRPGSMSILKPLIKLVNNLGDGNILFSLLTVLIVISYFLNQERYIKIFSTALSSSVLAGLLNIFFKMIVSRARPYVSLNPNRFFVYIDAYQQHKLFHTDYLSMPSGHTIVIFAAVIPFVLHCKKRIIKFILLTLPVLVGFARIYLFKHWLSDVIIAGFLGTLIGIATYRANCEEGPNISIE